jgi:hypothetical protein
MTKSVMVKSKASVKLWGPNTSAIISNGKDKNTSLTLTPLESKYLSPKTI